MWNKSHQAHAKSFLRSPGHSIFALRAGLLLPVHGCLVTSGVVQIHPSDVVLPHNTPPQIPAILVDSFVPESTCEGIYRFDRGFHQGFGKRRISKLSHGNFAVRYVLTTSVLHSTSARQAAINSLPKYGQGTSQAVASGRLIVFPSVRLLPLVFKIEDGNSSISPFILLLLNFPRFFLVSILNGLAGEQCPPGSSIAKLHRCYRPWPARRFSGRSFRPALMTSCLLALPGKEIVGIYSDFSSAFLALAPRGFWAGVSFLAFWERRTALTRATASSRTSAR